jgi:hypothetical protein
MTLEHGGYTFCVKRTCAETSTVYYSCKKFRQGCKAKLTVRAGEVVADKSSHNCTVVKPERIIDVRKEMRLELQQRSVKDMATPPSVLWQQVHDEMKRKYDGDDQSLSVIPCPPAVTIIKQTRKECTGGNVFEAILSEHVRCVSDADPLSFLQFSVVHPSSGSVSSV